MESTIFNQIDEFDKKIEILSKQIEKFKEGISETTKK